MLAGLEQTAVPALRWYGLGSSLLIGIGQSRDEIDAAACAQAGVSVHRRMSGGGAVFADEAGLEDIAGEQGQEGGAEAGALDVGGRGCGQAFEPDLAVMSDLGGEPVGTHERVGEPPGVPLQLAEGLGQPPGQGQIVELAKDLAVFQPQFVQR